MVPHLHLIPMVRSAAIIACTCRINDSPYSVSTQHKHDEPFDVQHIHRHHLDYDLRFRESEGRISGWEIGKTINKKIPNSKIEFFFFKNRVQIFSFLGKK